VDKPLLSVIVPVQRFVDGLERLTFWVNEVIRKKLPFQIILVQDGLDEEVRTLLRKLADSSHNEQVIFTQVEVRSPGLARNQGLELANGSWVAFWDSDDDVYVENVIPVLNSVDDTKSIVIAGYERLCLKSAVSEKGYQCNILGDVALELGLWRMFFRKERIQSVTFSALRMGEDQLFFSDISPHDTEIVYSPVVVYRYVRYSHGQLTSLSETSRDLEKCIVELCDRLLSNGQENEVIYYLFSRQSLTGLKKLGWSFRWKFAKLVGRLISRREFGSLMTLAKSFIHLGLARMRS